VLPAGRAPLNRKEEAVARPAIDLAAEVVEVIAETADATTLRLRLPQPVQFLAGQYFTVRLDLEGVAWPVTRSYSVASSPFPPTSTIDLTVKETPDGLASRILVRDIAVGTTLDVEGPFGYFTWEESDGGPLLLVAAGSGIVPLMCIVRYEAARRLEVPTTLLYVSADRAHVIFGDALDELAARSLWLSVTHAFTRDDTDPAARYHARVDAGMLAELVGDTSPSLLVYLCGPPEFVKDVETMLIAVGVPTTRIRTEDW